MTPTNDVPSTSVPPAEASTRDRPARPHVVVGVDGSDTSGAVLVAAADLANELDADLHAVLVYLPVRSHSGSWPIAVPATEMRTCMEGVLTDLVRDTFDGQPPTGMLASAVEGDPAKMLLALARHAEALVVSTSGHGRLLKLVLGSVSATCIEHSAVPVYVVHPPHRSDDHAQPPAAGTAADSTGRIVVGVDGSESSLQALACAGRLAHERRLGIDAVIAWRAPVYAGVMSMPSVPLDWNPRADGLACLNTCVENVFGDAGVERPADLRLIVEEGDPALHLTRRAERAALLVLGSRGLGGFAGLLLGSVSGKCANHATCPVLVVHGVTAGPTTPEPSVEGDLAVTPGRR